MLSIVEVTNRALRKQFIEFQNQLYQDCPQYVPTMLSDEMANLDPQKNPAFAYCDMRFFLALRDGKIVGRIGAIISHKANDIWGQKRIRITRFDFIDDLEVSALLVKTVEDWGREQGLTEIIGPIGFCDFDKEGMLVDGFSEPSMFITYYNDPYYVQHMEKLGFQKSVDWLEHRIYVAETKEEERLQRICDRVKKKYGFRAIRLKSKKELKRYAKPIFRLLNAEYSKLYGVVPITEAQMDWYEKQFLMLINLNFVELLEDQNGKLVGLGLLAPSLAEPMKKCGGKLFPFGWVSLLKAIRNPKILDMYFVAVAQEYRNSGAHGILMHDLTKTAREKGILYAETGPELESNYQVQGMWTGYQADRECRRRRCWEKTIAPSHGQE